MAFLVEMKKATRQLVAFFCQAVSDEGTLG